MDKTQSMLPPENHDILRYVKQKNTKKILLAVIWYLLLAAVTVYYSVVHPDGKEPSGLSYLAVALLALVPFFFFKIQNVFLDHNWEGMIVNKKYDQITESDRKFEPTWESLHTKTVVILTVKKDSGGKETLTLKDDSLILSDYYQEGDRVRHYRGIRFYEKLDKTKDNMSLCIVCGTLNSPDTAFCRYCGHSIVNIVL
ncbi:MAG: hypothetical protein BGN88_12955 [Clostridiales bacterium 43-6]|nr:MAG: hypothetical protein BGN88_12955 [Clostridiales bacterium 43-6]